MKRIYISEEVKNQLRLQLELAMSGKGLPAELKFATNPSVKLEPDQKLHIFFEWKAWSKMNALIQCCDKEIGFYGIVDRAENGKDFVINDIIVCPQTVTGTTVTTDDQEYSEWIEKIYDEYGEDVINKRRFYGHSHVRMACNPSVTDVNQYDDLLQTHDDFYIFGIFNKNGDYWFQVADIENNIYYEKDDIVYENVTKYQDWAKAEIEEKVKAYKYSGYQGNNYQYGGTGTQAWNGNQRGGYTNGPGYVGKDYGSGYGGSQAKKKR